MKDSDTATVKMVEAMQRDGSAAAVLDETKRYTTVEIMNESAEELRNKATNQLYAYAGKALMRLLAEHDEPLAVWLRTAETPIGYQNSNGAFRVVVETVPLKEVL